MLVSPRIRIVLLFAISASLVCWQASGIKPMDPDKECCDHLFYRSMSYNLPCITRPDLDAIPAGNRLPSVYQMDDYRLWMNPANGLSRQAPYINRPLAPITARVLAEMVSAGNINVGYYLLTILSLVATGTLLGWSALLATKRLMLAVLAVVVLLANPIVTAPHLSDYMLTDPLGYAMSALVVYLMLTRSRFVALALAAALLTKETLVFLLPCYPLYEWLSGRDWKRPVALTFAAFLPAVLYRLLITPLVPGNTFGTVYTGVPPWASMRFWVEGTFGAPLLVLALLGFWRSSFTLSLLPLIGVVLLASLIFADKERTFIYAFPLVTLSASQGLGWLAALATGGWRRIFTRSRAGMPAKP